MFWFKEIQIWFLCFLHLFLLFFCLRKVSCWSTTTWKVHLSRGSMRDGKLVDVMRSEEKFFFSFSHFYDIHDLVNNFVSHSYQVIFINKTMWSVVKWAKGWIRNILNPFNNQKTFAHLSFLDFIPSLVRLQNECDDENNTKWQTKLNFCVWYELNFTPNFIWDLKMFKQSN